MFRKQKQRYSPGEGGSKSGKKREYLQKGLAKIEKATLADQADKLQDAMQLYSKGIEHLYNSLRYDNLSDEERKGLKENYAVYYDRFQKLQQILLERKQLKGGKEKENVKAKFSNSKANQSPMLKREDNQSKEEQGNGRRKSDPPIELLRHVHLKSHQNSPTPSPVSSRRGSSNSQGGRPALTPEDRKLPEIPPGPVPDPGHHYETPIELRQHMNALSKPPPEYAKATPKSSAKITAQVHQPPKSSDNTAQPKGLSLFFAGAKSNRSEQNGVNGQQITTSLEKRPKEGGQTLNKRQSTYNKNPEDLAAKGLELLTHATEDDKNGRFVEAMKKYQHAVELIGFALKYGSLDESKMDSLRSKCALYLDRVEKLKALTNGQLETVEESQEERDERISSKSFQKRLDGYILIPSPTVKWSDVVGLEMAKETLKEHIILPIKYPRVFSNGPNSTKLRSVLFYGPPGSGKTFLMKAVLSKVKNTLALSVTSADIVSKWRGGSKEAVMNLFALARENKPCIVFVDDMEYIGTFPSPEESEAISNIRQQILKEMKGEGVNNDGVFFLGATSRPWALDPNMKKSFDKCVFLDLPDLPARMKQLNMHMKELAHSLNEKQMLHLAHKTESYSNADINCLINDAWMQPVRKLQAATHFKRVRTTSHTEGVYTPCSPGDEDAEEMTFVDLRSDQILEACLSFDDVLLSLNSMGRSVSDAEILKFQEFSKYNN